MKLTKAILNEHGIHNPHNFCRKGGGKMYITYTRQSTGRGGDSAKWQVIGLDFKTNPDGPWYNYGHLTFSVHAANEQTHHEVKETKRLAAIEWATQRYGITEWVRDPFGDYQAKDTYERVLALCKNGK